MNSAQRGRRSGAPSPTAGRRGCGCRRQGADSAELAAAAADQRHDWLQECCEVWEAFASWSHAPTGNRALLYADYLLALEREQQACELYARLLGELEQALARDHGARAQAWPQPDRAPRSRTAKRAKPPPSGTEPVVGR